MPTKNDVLFGAAVVNAGMLDVESIAESIEALFPAWVDCITTGDIRRHLGWD